MSHHQVPPMLPSFFKVLSEPSRPHLPLPPDFVNKHLKNKISQNPILQSVNGGFSWRVKFKKVGKVYSFADGWNRVVEDAQLVLWDFLVFWLVDSSTFKVLIFGVNGCEKQFPSNIKVRHEDDGGGGGGGGDEEEDDDGAGDVDREEVDPLFTTIIYKDYIYNLRLPAKFVRSAGIDKERIITIKNHSGAEWQVNLRYSRVYYLSTGWNDFRRCNQISEGDECVIKFIRSEDKLCLEKVTKKKQPNGKTPTTKLVVNRSRGRPPKRKKMMSACKVPTMEVMERPIGKDEGAEMVKRSRGRPPQRKKTPAGNKLVEVLKRKRGWPPCVEVVKKRSHDQSPCKMKSEGSGHGEYFNGYF